MARFVKDVDSTVPECWYMSLPHQGRVEVFQNHRHGSYTMTLAWQSNEFKWLLDSITIETAKREAIVKMRRWFAASVVEFDHFLFNGE